MRLIGVTGTEYKAMANEAGGIDITDTDGYSMDSFSIAEFALMMTEATRVDDVTETFCINW